MKRRESLTWRVLIILGAAAVIPTVIVGALAIRREQGDVEEEVVRGNLALVRSLEKEGEVLVTTRALYERKVVPVRGELPSLRYVLLTDGEDAGAYDLSGGDVLSLPALLAGASSEYTIGETHGDDRQGRARLRRGVAT